jgi:hypothetical protein
VAPPPPQFQPGFSARGPAADLKGVGGFLLVFCIFLTILWPLWTLSQYAFRYSLHRFAFLAANVLWLLRTVFGIAVGVSLWMESRSALMLLRIYFVVATILVVWSIVSFATFVTHYAGALRSGLIVPWITASLPYTLFLVLGIAYFARSERVRATFGANLL